MVIFKKFLDAYHVKHVTGKLYNPKYQGLIENYNRYVKNTFSLVFNK